MFIDYKLETYMLYYVILEENLTMVSKVPKHVVF